MPRINIDDSLWTDPKRRFLRFCMAIGDEVKALGWVVIAFRLAQRFWIPQVKGGPEKQLIPRDEWVAAGIPESFVQFDLAEIRKDGVYVRGSEEQFRWWFASRANGGRGGRPRKDNPEETHGLPSGNAPVSRGVPGGYPTKPSSSSSSSSSILSRSHALDSVRHAPQASPAERPAKVKQVSRAALEKLYLEEYPRHRGKKRGIAIASREIRDWDTFGKLKLAIGNYRAETSGRPPEKIKYFDRFMENWREHLELELVLAPKRKKLQVGGYLADGTPVMEVTR